MTYKMVDCISYDLEVTCSFNKWTTNDDNNNNFFIWMREFPWHLTAVKPYKIVIIQN